MIEYLEWDSNLFGLKVGSVSQLNTERLEQELKNAISEKYNLIYFFTAADCFVPNEILYKHNGKLVDRKVLYALELSEQPVVNVGKTKRFTKSEVSKDLLQLAYESGKYSRFKLDNNFAPEVFVEMYKLWIVNSVNGQIADRIYVVNNNMKIAAMVTLKEKSDTLQIGLMATAVDSTGNGFGKQLINRAQQTAIELGLNSIEVPTQYENTQACRFYEACGFQQKSITNIYHFWL